MVLLTVLQKVPYPGFERALAACKAQTIDVSEKDVVRCYHWAQAKGDKPCCYNNTPIAAAEITNFRDMPVHY